MALIGFGLALAAAPAATVDVPADVRTLVAEIERLHPDPYHSVSRADFHRAAGELAARAPALSREQALIETMRLVARLGEREGHSGVAPLYGGHRIPLHAFPWRLWRFPDGYYVTGAVDVSLVGARLVAVAGTPIADVEAQLPTAGNARQRVQPRVRPALLPRQRGGPARPRAHVEPRDGHVHRRHESRRDARGFASRVDRARVPARAALLVVHPRAAGASSQALAAVPAVEPRALRDHAAAARASRLPRLQPDDLPGPDPAPPAPARAQAEGPPRRHRPPPERWREQHDVRLAPGGTAEQDDQSPRQARGPHVASDVSAAGNFAADIDRSTRARFFGEPTGGSPNNYGDAQEIQLPALGVTVFTATQLVIVDPSDTRLSVEPDVPVSLTAADYFAGRDPVLAAALR